MADTALPKPTPPQTAQDASSSAGGPPPSSLVGKPVFPTPTPSSSSAPAQTPPAPVAPPTPGVSATSVTPAPSTQSPQPAQSAPTAPIPGVSPQSPAPVQLGSRPGAQGTPPPPPPASSAAPPTAAPAAPASGKPNQPPKKAVFANAKGSPIKFLPFVLGGLVLLAVVLFAVSRLFGGSRGSTPVPSANQNSNGQNQAPTAGNSGREQVTLTYWGLWEPTEAMAGVLEDFEDQNPGVLVNYQKQTAQDYRERLQTAIAAGQGPDVFRFHASWVPMLQSELAAVPSSVYSTSQFQSTFYPVALNQLQANGQLVGVPLMYDGLVLYYNKDILQTAGVLAPKTWAEMREIAKLLTVRTPAGIERGGLAAGTADNVDHFAEIIGLLTLQNGGDLTDPTLPASIDAMTFYTNFAKVDQVWSDQLPNSTVAFARGEVAMMFAPSWRYHEVKALNPSLNMAVAPVPSLADQDFTWATYWAEGVNIQSDNQDMAWALIAYLSSAEVMQELYAQQSQLRTFGEPYSRKDLASQVASDPVVSVVLQGADTAQGGFMNGWTFDGGLNDLVVKYYLDAVNAIIAGSNVTEAMETVALGTAQVLRQYGIGSQ